MDAVVFRWVLIAIALLTVLAIYLYGQHQSRLRRRKSINSVTREEIDSAFVEDEQLRSELDNLNPMLSDRDVENDLGDLEIKPSRDVQTTPFTLPSAPCSMRSTWACSRTSRLPVSSPAGISV